MARRLLMPRAMHAFTMVLGVFLLVAAGARAAHAKPGAYVYRPELVQTDVWALKDARDLTAVGIPLTIVGTLATVAAGILPATLPGQPSQIAAGTLGTGGGALLVTGVTLWAVGGRNARAARARLSAAPGGAGIAF